MDGGGSVNDGSINGGSIGGKTSGVIGGGGARRETSLGCHRDIFYLSDIQFTKFW